MATRSGRNVTDIAARLAPRGAGADLERGRDRDIVDQLRQEAAAAADRGETMLSDLERRAMRDAPPELRRQLMPRNNSSLNNGLNNGASDKYASDTYRSAPQAAASKPPAAKPPITKPAVQASRPLPPAPAPAPRGSNTAMNDKLMKVLMDVSDRLKRSESERELLWRELESTRRILDDLNDKTSKSDRANAQLQATLARRDALAEELIRKQQEIQTSQKILAGQVEDALSRTQNVEDRMQMADTTSSSLMVKINDLLGDGVKLSRRLDQMTQDKTRLLRKIELVEDTLLQTQDTLRAKALVLLTDQSIAARTNLPQEALPSGSLNPALPGGAAMPRASLFERPELPHWMQAITKRPVMATSALVAGGLLLGWALNGAPMPTITRVTEQPAQQTQAEKAPAETLARATAAPSAPLNDAALLVQMQDAEQKAASTIANGESAADITASLSPDASLPDVVRTIENQAFAGSPEAQHDLAAIYTAGHAGVAQNYGRAIEWFTLAARNGVANARYNLGVLYHQGLGAPQDITKAVQYYNGAAFLGHPEALYNLGIAALAGEGMAQSRQAAMLYFTRSANLGLVEAAFNLGRMQEEAIPADADKAQAANSDAANEAIFWYKLAADRDHTGAKTALDALASRLGLKASAIKTRYTETAKTHPEATKALGNGGIAAEEAAAIAKATPKAVPASIPSRPTQADNSPRPAPAIDTARPGIRELSESETRQQQTVAIISQIQEQLARQGLYKGEADGQLSTETQDAISRYQKQNNMRVTGQPTEDLLVNMLAREFSIDVSP